MRNSFNGAVSVWKCWNENMGQKCTRFSVSQNEFVVFPFMGARS